MVLQLLPLFPEEDDDIEVTFEHAYRPSVTNPNTYVSGYCEENVYRLLAHRLDCLEPAHYQRDRDFVKNLTNLGERFFVICISNSVRVVPFFAQRLMPNGSYVMWDYHVVLMEHTNEGTVIWDFDSLLPFPCDYDTYFKTSLNDNGKCQVPDRWSRYFRFIPARIYLRYFSSNRIHMQKGEKWISPPPKWPIIYDESLGNNLDQLLSTRQTDFPHPSLVVDEGLIFDQIEIARPLGLLNLSTSRFL